jgi:hypothetical protein
MTFGMENPFRHKVNRNPSIVFTFGMSGPAPPNAIPFRNASLANVAEAREKVTYHTRKLS